MIRKKKTEGRNLGPGRRGDEDPHEVATDDFRLPPESVPDGAGGSKKWGGRADRGNTCRPYKMVANEGEITGQRGGALQECTDVIDRYQRSRTL